MSDSAELPAPTEDSLDGAVDALHRILSFFSESDYSLPYLTESIGKYAVFVYIAISLATRIKEHHWQLRRFTNSVPSTFVSNATRKSNVWVKLHYSDDALPSNLKKSPSLRTLKKHGFECVGAGDAIKLQMERFSLNLFVSVFVESDALETATPIALLHPLAIRQSLIVTKEKTIALMSADNPSVDSEGNLHEIARSIASKQFIDENKKSVSNATRKGFWRFFDWCLWRCDSGIFSSRPKLSIANRSNDLIWVRCGLQSLAKLDSDEDLESIALCGLTKIAPWSSIAFHPFHGGLDATQTLKMHVDVYKGRHLKKLTLNEVQSHVVPLNHVLGIYSDDDSLTTYEEQKVMKKKKKSVNFGNLNFDSDDESDVSDLDVEEAQEENNNSEEREENPWSKENNWHPLAQTHVANATEFPIWVNCLTDVQEYDKLNSDLKESFLKDEMNIVKQLGFTKINSRKFLVFEPPIRNDPTCRVFITVMLEREDRTLEIISSNYPVFPNYSIIVSKELVIHRTEMGEIWYDIAEVKHNYWTEGRY